MEVLTAREALSLYRASAGAASKSPASGGAGHIIIYDRQRYRVRETAGLASTLEAAGYTVERMPHPADSNDIIARTPQFPHQPAAVLRWEEHGVLFSNDDWQRSLRHLYAQGVVALQVDYGYFDHANTLLVDLYRPDGRRSIETDWGGLPETDPWVAADERLCRYRDSILAERERAIALQPLEDKPYGVIWLQASAWLSRGGFLAGRKSMRAWVDAAAGMLRREGLVPVVKASPWASPDVPAGMKVYGGRGNRDRGLNVRLAVHAKANLILTSSVSNELVILSAPVTALGRSWFNGLGVFHEPLCRDEPVARAEDVDESARNRWCAWWLSRQCYPEDAARVVGRLISRGRSLMAPPQFMSLGSRLRGTHPARAHRLQEGALDKAAERQGRRDVLFVTFHTDDPYYRDQVKPLIASLERLSLPFKVYVEKNTGDWKKNTWKKPRVIRRALLEHPGCRVVFLDADAEVVEYPVLLRQIDADFAAHWRFGWMLLSGTLMFDNTPAALELLDLWEDHLHAGLKGDQDALGAAVHECLARGLKAANLPASYTAIDGLMPIPHPTIRHRMAHRRGRSAVRAQR